jgi:hypothetical protein
MKPKEKAKELFDKMQVNAIYKSKSKDCALIAVDEILKSKPYWDTEEEFNYWNEVKQEIEQL